VIVLDQFSRNVFRDTPHSFAQDQAALKITLDTIKQVRQSTFERRLLVSCSNWGLEYFVSIPFPNKSMRLALGFQPHTPVTSTTISFMLSYRKAFRCILFIVLLHCLFGIPLQSAHCLGEDWNLWISLCKWFLMLTGMGQEAECSGKDFPLHATNALRKSGGPWS